MIQTRPFASGTNWMAPHALAAELTARAGASIGAGYAAGGENLAHGVTTGIARRDRLEENAVQNELRRAALRQSDEHFQASLKLQQEEHEDVRARSAYSALADYETGATAQLQQIVSGAADPQAALLSPEVVELTKNLERARASKRALTSKLLGKLGIAEAANIPEALGSDVLPPPRHETSYPGGEPKIQPASAEELSAALAEAKGREERYSGVAPKNPAAYAEWVVGKGKAARDVSLYSSQLKKVEQEEGERRRAAIQTAEEQAKTKAKDEADRLSDNQELAGFENAPVQDLPAGKGKGILARKKNEATADRQREMLEARQKFQRERDAQAAAAIESRFQRIRDEKGVEAAITDAEQEAGAALKYIEIVSRKIPADPEEVASATRAWTLLKDKAAVERQKRGSVQTPAQGSTGNMPDAAKQAEAEYDALPDDQKTPEAAARIAKKYGLR